jgi:hypothetical protein
MSKQVNATKLLPNDIADAVWTEVSDLVEREGVGAASDWKYLNGVVEELRHKFPSAEWRSVHIACYTVLIICYGRFMKGFTPRIREEVV